MNTTNATARLAELNAERQALVEGFIAYQNEVNAKKAELDNELNRTCNETNVALGKILGRIEDLEAAIAASNNEAQSHGDEPV